MDRLKGKVAFITGSGSGIGRAASVLFAAESAKVAVADVSRTGGEETVRMVRDAGGEAAYVETDVTDPASVERAIKSVAERWGKLDVLYNNAGGSTAQDGRVTEVSLEEWWRAIRLDLFGTFLCCRYGIPESDPRRRRGGDQHHLGGRFVRSGGARRLHRRQRRSAGADEIHGRRVRQGPRPGERARAGGHAHRPGQKVPQLRSRGPRQPMTSICWAWENPRTSRARRCSWRPMTHAASQAWSCRWTRAGPRRNSAAGLHARDTEQVN